MAYLYVPVCTVVVLLASLWLPGHALGAQRDDDQKPSLSLRATPPVGFSPLRVRAATDIRGGSDDYQEFYCATVEWDWGDGTTSENSTDCEPYEAGKSTIRRRFTAEHVYRQQGNYRITFRLKQKTRVVGATTATVQVRGGAGEGLER
ncbi:MAG: PKD domain-containing protein [Acidobacteria bacterium]|nr:PKD domain-containing protein [Acidobacteriota bacterium]